MNYEITSFHYTPDCVPSKKYGLVYEEPHDSSSDEMRDIIFKFEDLLAQSPEAKFGDDVSPLRHTFVDGAYVREITMEAGIVLTSKEHNTTHPFFVMEGDCTIVTDKVIQRIKAPYWGVTTPGTKRVIHVHKKTVWVTVHATDSKDLTEIERDIIKERTSYLEESI